MVNHRGQVVGLHSIGVTINNSAVAPYSGFAPMNQLAGLLPALERGQGQAVEPGFSVTALQIHEAAQAKLRADGVKVTGVAPGSPAANAGLQQGDLIVGLRAGLTSSTRVRFERATPGAVQGALDGLYAGGQLSLQVQRQGAGGPTTVPLQIGY